MIYAFCLSLLLIRRAVHFSFFFLNDPAPPEISPLPLPDALPIPPARRTRPAPRRTPSVTPRIGREPVDRELREVPASDRALAQPLLHPKPHRIEAVLMTRSEEHTSELQSPCNLVCRLLLEKKKHY